jgi:hypothetical protein
MMVSSVEGEEHQVERVVVWMWGCPDWAPEVFENIIVGGVRCIVMWVTVLVTIGWCF